MPCVYILVSLKDNKRYIGSTINLDRRLKEHNDGLVNSTKYRKPLKLVYLQPCETLIVARLLESKYKKSRGAFNKAIKLGSLRRVA